MFVIVALRFKWGSLVTKQNLPLFPPRDRWIGERLAMGHETRVSQSVRAVADAEHGELLTLRRSLERMLIITD